MSGDTNRRTTEAEGVGRNHGAIIVERPRDWLSLEPGASLGIFGSNRLRIATRKLARRLNTSAIVGTNPMGELMTSRLPVSQPLGTHARSKQSLGEAIKVLVSEMQDRPRYNTTPTHRVMPMLAGILEFTTPDIGARTSLLLRRTRSDTRFGSFPGRFHRSVPIALHLERDQLLLTPLR